MQTALATKGLHELFDRQHRDAQRILRLKPRSKHGGKRVLRNLGDSKARVQHHRLAQPISDLGEVLHRRDGHRLETAEGRDKHGISHVIELFLTISPDAHHIVAVLSAPDAFSEIQPGGSINQRQGRTIAHAAVHGVLRPAHHVVKDIVDRLHRALHPLVSLDRERTQELLRPLAFFDLIFTEEGDVVSVRQKIFRLLLAIQTSVNHHLERILANAVPGIGHLRKLREQPELNHARLDLLGRHVNDLLALLKSLRPIRQLTSANRRAATNPCSLRPDGRNLGIDLFILANQASRAPRLESGVRNKLSLFLGQPVPVCQLIQEAGQVNDVVLILHARPLVEFFIPLDVALHQEQVGNSIRVNSLAQACVKQRANLLFVTKRRVHDGAADLIV